MKGNVWVKISELILTHMFDDKSRPQYLRCERIILDRISTKDYTGFIQQIAQKTWGKRLADETISTIFTLTERHPYYINLICNTLWKYYEDKAQPPDSNAVKKYWQEYIYTERARISRELTILSFGQRKILTAIAFGFGFVTELTGKSFLQRVGVTGPSVITALEVLKEQDIVAEKEDGSYFIIDPLMKASLQFFYQDAFATQ